MYIEAYIIDNENYRMKKLIENINKYFDIILNSNQVYYILRINKITFKKAKYQIIKNKQDHDIKVKALVKKVNEIDQDNITSIDESHFYLNMSPSHGWGKEGDRVVFTKKTSIRTSISLICAINNKKVIYYEIIKGSVNSTIYLQFLKNLNKRCKHKYYLMDNCRTHHAKIVKEHMNKVTNNILYNVPYSPETNPIEQFFNKVKTYVRKENTETMANIINAIHDAIKTVTPSDLNNFFKHSFNH